jgi:TRAP-type C4-dicarboxylate transport system substrate-binding protein
VAEFSTLKYSAMQKIKWLSYHPPTQLFSKTAEDFQKHLNDLTSNKYEIEILPMDNCDPVQELTHGRVHMSQIYSNLLGKYGATDLYALILPYLFQSVSHADRVLRGEVGEKLLHHLYLRTGIRGLSFNWMEITKKFYSRISFPRFYPNAWWGDINNPRMKEHNPIMNDMTDLVMSNILNTANGKHSTYLTTIVANNQFMDTLSEQDQQHFIEAARRTSKVSEQTENYSDEELEKLREAWAPLYKKYSDFFSFDVVGQIKNHTH